MTLRQKKLIKNLGKYKTIEEAMLKSDYSPSTAHQQKEILKGKGFVELLEKYLPDEEILQTHKEGLRATKIITSLTEPDREVPDHPTRLKAVDMAYKVKGKQNDNPNFNQQVNINEGNAITFVNFKNETIS